MGDQLEQFIMKNRSSFDDAEPSEKVWKGIDKKVRKSQNFLQVAWKVAAVIFMVSTVYLLLEKNLRDSQFDQLVAESAQQSEELQQAEDYYTQLINVKKLEIQEQLTPDEQDEFLEEIEQLDELYLELKKTYQTTTASERIVDAMINNLQLRLNILNKQLEILENVKDQNNESEPVSET